MCNGKELKIMYKNNIFFSISNYIFSQNANIFLNFCEKHKIYPI